MSIREIADHERRGRGSCKTRGEECGDDGLGKLILMLVEGIDERSLRRPQSADGTSNSRYQLTCNQSAATARPYTVRYCREMIVQSSAVAVDISESES